MSLENAILEVTDDSGFLALIDPDRYVGFVHKDWELGQLMAHFKAEMSQRHLLVWGTGGEGFWRVEVSTSHTAAEAFREVVGPIAVSGGRLLVTNYEDLTMAAGFQEVTLPEAHNLDLLVPLPDGIYNCRVLQMFNPDEESMAPGSGPDFVLELLREDPPAATWRQLPWSDV